MSKLKISFIILASVLFWGCGDNNYASKSDLKKSTNKIEGKLSESQFVLPEITLDVSELSLSVNSTPIIPSFSPIFISRITIYRLDQDASYGYWGESDKLQHGSSQCQKASESKVSPVAERVDMLWIVSPKGITPGTGYFLCIDYEVGPVTGPGIVSSRKYVNELLTAQTTMPFPGMNPKRLVLKIKSMNAMGYSGELITIDIDGSLIWEDATEE